MKKLLATIIIGLIMLFFIDTAFKIDGLTQRMLIDNTVRFFIGFLSAGIWIWSRYKRKSKVFMYVFLLLLISDVIYDYIQGISTLEIEMTLHDLFFFFWGSISGYFFVKYLHCRKLIIP